MISEGLVARRVQKVHCFSSFEGVVYDDVVVVVILNKSVSVAAAAAVVVVLVAVRT